MFNRKYIFKGSIFQPAMLEYQRVRVSPKDFAKILPLFCFKKFMKLYAIYDDLPGAASSLPTKHTHDVSFTLQTEALQPKRNLKRRCFAFRCNLGRLLEMASFRQPKGRGSKKASHWWSLDSCYGEAANWIYPKKTSINKHQPFNKSFYKAISI